MTKISNLHFSYGVPQRVTIAYEKDQSQMALVDSYKIAISILPKNPSPEDRLTKEELDNLLQERLDESFVYVQSDEVKFIHLFCEYLKLILDYALAHKRISTLKASKFFDLYFILRSNEEIMELDVEEVIYVLGIDTDFIFDKDRSFEYGLKELGQRHEKLLKFHKTKEEQKSLEA